MPATNAPRASDTPKNAADPSAVPTAIVNATSTNSSRDRVWTTRPRMNGTTRAPTNIISATNRTALPIASAAVAHGPDVDGPASTGKQDEDRDDQQVLDHEPADRDLAVRRVEPAVVHQAAHLDDGAGDRSRDAEDPGAAGREAPGAAQAVAHGRDDGHLDDRARE